MVAAVVVTTVLSGCTGASTARTVGTSSLVAGSPNSTFSTPTTVNTGMAPLASGTMHTLSSTGGTSKDGQVPGATAGVVGRWFSRTVTGHTLVAGSTVSLAISADGRWGMSSGCNGAGSRFVIEPGTLTSPTTMVSSTLMGCSGEKMAQDNWLTQFITSNPTYSVKNGSLILAHGEVSITFVGQRAELLNRTWYLTGSVGPGSGGFADPAGASVTITEHQLQANFGCSTGDADVDVSTAVITIAAVNRTAGQCGGNRDRIEKWMTDLLTADSTITYEAAEHTLVLSRSAGGAGLSFTDRPSPIVAPTPSR